MKNVFLILTLASVTSLASTFTLTDNQSGTRYQCSVGGGGLPVDPKCEPQIRQYCYMNTSLGDDECFSKATSACSMGVTLDCIQQVDQDCQANTSLGEDACFNQSIPACGGSQAAISMLMKSAKMKAVADAAKK